MEIRVLDIRKSKFSDSICVAFVNLQIDNLIIDGFRVINGRNGMFLSYPREKGKDDKWYDIIRPMDMNTKAEIENYVLKEYQRYCNNQSVNQLPPEAE